MAETVIFTGTLLLVGTLLLSTCVCTGDKVLAGTGNGDGDDIGGDGGKICSENGETAEAQGQSSRDGVDCVPDPPGEMSGRWIGLRDEAWVIPLMAVCAFNITVIGFFEVFVLVKTLYARPSRRHLFLGQMLLLGLLLASVVGFAFCTHPSLATCTVARLGVGVAYALILTTLLVKCIFLISLNSGVYLPAAYLGLLLFFSVAVQLVLVVEWLVLVPPTIVFREAVWSTSGDGGGMTWPPQCNTGFAELVFSLVYVMFLLLFVGVLSIKSCGIRDNYRESTYIAVSIGCVTAVWLTWMVLGLVMGEDYGDPCVAFGLACSATLIFLIMFLPKGRQLAALGQEGLYVEDRVDVLSNAPSAAYAPSFYHFTPAFVPVWDNPPPLAIQKNAITDRKNHKPFAPAYAVSMPRPPKPKPTIENPTYSSRYLGTTSPNMQTSMMY